MTDSLLIKSQTPDTNGTFAAVTAKQAGWEYLNMEAFRLNKGQTRSGQTNGSEQVFVLLGGQCRFRSDKMDFGEIGRRPNVFSGMPWAVYLSRNSTYEIEALMDEELETHHQEQERIISAMQSLADGTPALGIVAAVLGVIKTMGAIKEPPEVLGHLIGGALVGTFFGVFVAYGFFGPMAQSLKSLLEAESKYYFSLKAGLIAHISGQPPVMAVEFARKALMSDVRPTFNEVETATAALPA